MEGSWGAWCGRAATSGNLPVNCDYNVNIATDCSSLGVPELALMTIGKRWPRMKIQSVFACDLAASPAFLARGVTPRHILAGVNMCDRKFKTDGLQDSFTTTTRDGQAGPASQTTVLIVC